VSSELELHGYASDRARAYQQGHGHQYNIDRAVFEESDSHQQILSFGSALVPLVCEADPIEIGVHRAAILNGNAVPTYIPRDVDDELSSKIAAAAERGGFIVIVGDSTAGKTRSAYEALLRVAPNYRLIHPYNRTEFTASLATVAMAPRKTVLWLDDIERYIDGNGLTPRIVVQLKRMGVICVSTIRSEKYRGLTSLSDIASTAGSRSHEEMVSFEHVLKLADVVLMDRKWSAAEVARAGDAEDLRIAEARNHHSDYGLAEYLAAGPKLYEELSLSSMVNGNPRGVALVKAAIDCQRAGVYDSIPVDILRAVHEHYLDLAGGPLLRPESFDHALMWAASRRYGVTSLLIPGKEQGSYRAFDYLVDRVLESDEGVPVPDIVWTTLRGHFATNDGQLNVIALAASLQDKREISIEIWEKLSERRDSRAAKNLGRMFDRSQDYENAEIWYKKAISFGNISAAITLGHLIEYEYSDRISEAEAWYEHAARNDDPHGMYHMGIICQQNDREEEAEEWFRKAVDRKELIASSGLGELLVSSGRLVEAESLLKDAVDKGDCYAMNYLGVVYRDLKREKEAEQLWLKAAAEGLCAAKINLGRLYSDWKRDRDSEKFFLEAISDGHLGALGIYAHFLAERQRWAKADEVGQKAVEEGDTAISICLAEMLMDAKRFSDAESWYRTALQANEDRAVSGMARLLDRVGRHKEAAIYWQKLVDLGDGQASFALAKVKLSENDMDGAILLLERAAEEDRNIEASCELGRIYRRLGNIEKAIKWMTRSVDNGHIHAACVLGTVYEGLKDYELAEKYWTIAYRKGGKAHLHAARYLSSMLAAQGRGREAADWLARSNGVYEGKKKQDGANRRRRRR
jgi:TPR repeat protein